MEQKIIIRQGKVFVYNEDSCKFQETINAELIGYLILDMAEKQQDSLVKKQILKIKTRKHGINNKTRKILSSLYSAWR